MRNSLYRHLATYELILVTVSPKGDQVAFDMNVIPKKIVHRVDTLSRHNTYSNFNCFLKLLTLLRSATRNSLCRHLAMDKLS